MSTGTTAATSVNHVVHEHTAARSRMYALFAEAFAYPDDTRSSRLSHGDLLRDLAEAAAALPAPIATPTSFELPSGSDARDEIQVVYTGLFDACGGRPQISLLERRYRDRREPEQPLWEDLLRFYRFFGLDFSGGAAGENPDHLLLELEFLHYLTFLEAGSRACADDLRRGQRDFLVAHLKLWSDALAGALSGNPDAGPYAALAESMAEFVAGDLRYLEVLVGVSTSGTGD